MHPGSCPIGTATRACQQSQIISPRDLGRRGRGSGGGEGTTDAKDGASGKELGATGPGWV